MRYLLALLLLSGCGFTVTDQAFDEFEAKSSGIMTREFVHPCGPVHVTAQFPIDPVRFSQKLRVAKEVAARRGLIPEDQFCGILILGSIEVQKWNSIDNKHQLGGLYSAFAGIFLANNGDALLHEMLHAWNVKHFQPGTYAHLHWETNGYNAASTEFVQESEPVCIYGQDVNCWRLKEQR